MNEKCTGIALACYAAAYSIIVLLKREWFTKKLLPIYPDASRRVVVFGIAGVVWAFVIIYWVLFLTK